MRAGDKVRITSGENKGRIGTVIGPIIIGQVQFWAIEFEDGNQNVLKESAFEIIPPE